MTSASDSRAPDYSLRHIRPDGSSIRVDPPFGPFVKPGQYDRLLNSKLLDPKAVDVKEQQTVEGVFNRLMSETETPGLATNFLYQIQQGYDDRFAALAREVEENYQEMRTTIEGLAKIVEHCRTEAASYELRLRMAWAQLKHIYAHGMNLSSTAVPLPPTPSLYPVKDVELEPAVSEAEKRFRMRLFGKSRGEDRLKEQEYFRRDEELRTEILVRRVEEQTLPAAPLAEEPPSPSERPATILSYIEKPLVDKLTKRLDLIREQVKILTGFSQAVQTAQLDGLEQQERTRSRILERHRTKVTKGVWETMRYLRPLLPHLEECEAAARAIEQHLHPERRPGPIPLVSISFDKPVDEMSEAEMRELLKTLPATVCLDPASLQAPCKFEAPPREEASAQAPGKEHTEEHAEEDGNGEFDVDDIAQAEGGTEELGRQAVNFVPASSVVRTPAQAAAAAKVRFGETSFPGRAAGSGLKPPYPGIGTPFPAGRTGEASRVTSTRSAVRSAPGVPSIGSASSIGHAVSEGHGATLLAPTVSKKRVRSPTDSNGEEGSRAPDHQADATAKKRKLQ